MFKAGVLLKPFKRLALCCWWLMRTAIVLHKQLIRDVDSINSKKSW